MNNDAKGISEAIINTISHFLYHDITRQCLEHMANALGSIIVIAIISYRVYDPGYLEKTDNMTFDSLGLHPCLLEKNRHR